MVDFTVERQHFDAFQIRHIKRRDVPEQLIDEFRAPLTVRSDMQLTQHVQCAQVREVEDGIVFDLERLIDRASQGPDQAEHVRRLGLLLLVQLKVERFDELGQFGSAAVWFRVGQDALQILYGHPPG